MNDQPPSWFHVANFPLDADLSLVHKVLLQRRVIHHIHEEQGLQVLLVHREADIPVVRDLLQQWQHGELEAMVAAHGGFAGTLTGLLHHSDLIIKAVPLTCLLLLGSIIGYAAVQLENSSNLAYWMTFSKNINQFTQTESLRDILLQKQYWRFITPIFLHFSIYHLVFNALFVWVFGGRIEQVVGTLHFTLFVLIAALASNVAQFWWEANPLFGGMSGVNYAFIGYIWLRQVFAPRPLLAMPKGIIAVMIIWLLLGVFGVIDLFMAGSIANGAHVTGFMVGILWGALDGLHKSWRATP